MKPPLTFLHILVLLALITALIPISPARAAKPQPPVEIFGPGPCTAGSTPQDLVTGADIVYFTAYEGIHGREIYRSDGTLTGTWRVTELAPGAESLAPVPKIVSGGKLFFTTKEPPDATSPKQRLWVTDGTPAVEGSTGAVKLLDFWPESSEYTISAMAELDGVLYFIVKNQPPYQYASRYELWRTDGSDSGTWLVKEYTPYAYDGRNELIAYKGYLYFVGSNDPTRNVLWRSDGTPEGTGPFTGVSWPYKFTNSGGFLYFISSMGGDWVYLYRTDGTVDGTVKVADLPYNSRPGYLTDLNGTLYFSMINDYQGELWHTDGTPAGTHLIKNFGNTSYGAIPAELTAAGGILFFSSESTGYDRELWKTDGTLAGTVQVKDLRPGEYGSNPIKLRAFRGKVYFLTTNLSTDAVQLWRSDGTSAGTQMLLDSGIFPMDNADGEIAISANRLFFSGVAKCAGWEMQTLAAGSSTLQLVTDINLSVLTTNMKHTLTRMGGLGYFFANDYVHGFELWRSDGTPQGTRMVKDINPSGSTSVDYFPEMVAAGPMVYFNVGNAGLADLWRTDGSAAGTQPVKLSDGTTFHGSLYGATAFQNRLFFFTQAYLGWDLWKTDGTPAGTRKLANLPGRAYGTELNGKLYYLLAPSDSEQQLWVTDGTAAGTVAVKSLQWSSTVQPPRTYLLRIGQRLYFLGWDAHGIQPWVTDGTWSGTHLLAEVDAEHLAIISSGDTLYIYANDEPGYRLWTMRDADEGNLTLLRESTSLIIEEYRSAGGKFFFIETEPNASSPSLWVSDGTAEGTRVLLPAGGEVSVNFPLFAAHPYVFFTATDQAGQELWQSDGTPEGTHRIADLWPGPESSQPWFVGYDGARLYFTAADGSTPERQVLGSIVYAYNTLTEQLFLPVSIR